MATRCAETSSEYGQCHMTKGGMMGGGVRHQPLRHRSFYFEGVTSRYDLVLQIKGSHILRAPLPLAKAEVAWLGVSCDLMLWSVLWLNTELKIKMFHWAALVETTPTCDVTVYRPVHFNQWRSEKTRFTSGVNSLCEQVSQSVTSQHFQ